MIVGYSVEQSKQPITQNQIDRYRALMDSGIPRDKAKKMVLQDDRGYFDKGIDVIQGILK